MTELISYEINGQSSFEQVWTRNNEQRDKQHTNGRFSTQTATKTHVMSQEEEVVLKPGEDFLCTQCNTSLIGQRYILNDEKPYCVSCYEQQFSNTCESCKEKIKCDSKDLSFKDKHWHEKCFFCSVCKAPLADKPFTTKDSDLFCPDCYDEKFSPRCDGCKKIFKAGSRKYEYKGSTWHEECFTCIECKQPLGTKSFVPKDDGVVCVPCYEEKYSQRCFKCTKPIQKGGVTYKGQPWHKTCFLCVNCNTELSGQKFTSKDDQPYCADCYTQLFAKRCHKCTKPISGFGGCKFITFEDKHWHSDCFNCSKCENALVGKGFLINEDGIFCPDCGK
ncbi:hypothetical protein EG68_01184 [Paragonimus skrjabini miyazakii]|uniref:LIM zinc-binding domain-containing protein n=1 Tax=Paragonimus skrjabini miyazakii TaxID=59628 RepID=A0A8S9Z369_9TREM|nr:hypothetical protein EG68_01184 [Paragonimus skrjabini miyazakii]